MCRISAQSGPGGGDCHFVSPTVILSVVCHFVSRCCWSGPVRSGPENLENLLYIGLRARMVEIWTAKFFYFYKYLIFNKLQEKCKFF